MAPTKTCRHCGQMFTKPVAISHARWEGRKHCSVECRQAAARRAPREAPCVVDGCAHVRAPKSSMCESHRYRKRVYGDPTFVPASRLGRRQGDSVMWKLLAGIISDDDCWLWGRGRTAFGYGAIQVSGQPQRGAHVVMWETFHGRPVPEGMSVCHSCDVPACINPDHLWIGTHQDNMRDMVAKGRHRRWPNHINQACAAVGIEGP